MESKKTAVVVNGALEGKTFRDADSHASIKDATLRKSIKAYNACETKVFSESWKAVRLIGEMATHIKQDFGSDRAFAEYMDSATNTINKYRRIAKFADEFEAKGISVSKACELLALGDDKAIRGAITDGLAEQTQKDIRAAVKAVKQSNDKEKVSEKAKAVKEEKKATKEKMKESRKASKDVPRSEEQILTDNQYLVPTRFDDDSIGDVNLMLTEEQKATLADLVASFLVETGAKYNLWD